MRYLTLLLFLFLLCYPSRLLALEFSEIAYDIAGSDDGREWLEVHNETDQPVDLTGYYFADGSNHTLTPPPGKAGQGSLVLPAGGYLILADDAALFLTDHPGYAGAVVDTTMSLSNYSSTRTEPIVFQLLDPQKNLISEASFLPTEKGQRGYTLELDSSLVWVDSQKVGGSPGSVRPPPQPPEPLPAVHLSEIVSNPEGADAGAEVVELYNAGSQAVSLEGWYLTDKPTESGNVNRHTITGLSPLPAGGYAVITLKGSFLNNKDEAVSLFTSDDRLVESLTLPGAALEGQSYALVTASWQWTTQLTLGAANSLVVASGSSPKTPSSSSSKTTSSSPVNSGGSKAAFTASTAASAPSSTKRNSSAAASPSSRPKVAANASSSSPISSLPTRLSSVAGVTTTESPSALFGYLTTFLPPLALLGGLGFYLYKKKLLFFKPRPP